MVPTVLDVLGIEKPKNLPGISVLDKEKLEGRDIIFGEIYAHDFESIELSLFYDVAISKPYKIIIPDSERKKDEKIQLFNIDEDPFEKNDLAENNPEIVEVLKKKIKTFRAE
jgi:uncharacterized sulfatase